MLPFLRRASHRREADGIHRPLLNEQEQAELIHSAQLLRRQGAFLHEVHFRHVGDFRSAFFGRGLDFEESRLYQPGDDVRDMDWRTTARTGKPYLKIYREEHQPALHVLLDRGASMRFGSHVRLKVTQAVRIAGLFAFAAMGSQTSIGGTLWQPGGFDLPARSGEEGAMALMRAALAPCPPLREPDSKRESFRDVLERISHILPAGSRLVVISDFSEMQEADTPLLLRLATRHHVIPFQVLDGVEAVLPDVGSVRFRDLASGRMRRLDTHSRAVREQYQQQTHALRAAQLAWFRRVGIHLRSCSADADPFPLVQQVMSGG